MWTRRTSAASSGHAANRAWYRKSPAPRPTRSTGRGCGCGRGRGRGRGGGGGGGGGTGGGARMGRGRARTCVEVTRAVWQLKEHERRAGAVVGVEQRHRHPLHLRAPPRGSAPGRRAWRRGGGAAHAPLRQAHAATWRRDGSGARGRGGTGEGGREETCTGELKGSSQMTVAGTPMRSRTSRAVICRSKMVKTGRGRQRARGGARRAGGGTGRGAKDGRSTAEQ